MNQKKVDAKDSPKDSVINDKKGGKRGGSIMYLQKRSWPSLLGYSSASDSTWLAVSDPVTNPRKKKKYFISMLVVWVWVYVIGCVWCVCASLPCYSSASDSTLLVVSDLVTNPYIYINVYILCFGAHWLRMGVRVRVWDMCAHHFSVTRQCLIFLH